MHNQAVGTGHEFYKNYLKSEKEMFANQENEYIRPPQNDQHGIANIRRALTIARGVAADTYHYKDLLAIDVGLRDARFIARYYPETTLSIYFIEQSVVYPEGDLANLETGLRAKRAISASTVKAPVVAETITNTLHGSFNNRTLIAQYLETSVANQSDTVNSVN